MNPYRREQLLAKPVWQMISGQMALSTLPDLALLALDSFFEHMNAHAITAPDVSDLHAWSTLGAGEEGLEHLLEGMAIIAPEDPALPKIREALNLVRQKTQFRGLKHGVRRAYFRTVSVDPSELPIRWKEVLRELAQRRDHGDTSAPAPDILERMTQKLGQYILVMRNVGLAEDLHQPGLTAFYAHVSTRVTTRTGSGLRPATIRATFEELERFARHAGDYDETLIAGLRRTLATLVKEEDQTIQQKYAKAHGLGGPPDIISGAFGMLVDVAAPQTALLRHMRRNRAAAIALPAVLPLRRDWNRIIFGKTIYWAGDRYRFRNFKLGKTALLDNRRTFPGSIHPRLTPFVDALVLQDVAPRYLVSSRCHVEQTERPLFVNPDGSPCAQSYVSRVWSETHGTGATIARTLLHDFFGAQGEEGVHKAMIVCDQYARQTAEKYRGASIDRQQLEAAQDDILDECNDLEGL